MSELVVALVLGASPLLCLGIARLLYSVANFAQQVGDEAEHY